MQRSRTRTICLAVLVSGTSLFMALAAVEFVLAPLLLPAMHQEVDKRFDEELGWLYEPGVYRIKSDAALLPHEITIGPRGIRESADAGHADGAARVIVLGDSFTFAKAMPDDALYVARTQAALEEQSGSRVALVNAAAEGFGTAQQLLLLRRLLRDEPHTRAIVLQLFTNDILDNLRLDYGSQEAETLRPAFRREANGGVTLTALPVRPPPRAFAPARESRLRTLSVARSLLETQLQGNPTAVRILHDLGVDVSLARVPGVVNGWYRPEVLEPGLALTRALVRTMREEAERHGAAFLAMLVPSPLMVYRETYGPLLAASFPDDEHVAAFLADPQKPRRLFLEMCADLAIDCLDLWPPLHEARARGVFLPREGHLSDAGHAVVARALAPRLRAHIAR